LAVECRADDAATMARLQAIEHSPSRQAVDAERSFLAELGGGCDLPVGAYATVDGAGMISLTALLASLDGRIVLRHDVAGDDAATVGRDAALYLLDKAGGRALLDDSPAS
jgi:hydroxymethylbilane synthase